MTLSSQNNLSRLILVTVLGSRVGKLSSFSPWGKEIFIFYVGPWVASGNWLTTVSGAVPWGRRVLGPGTTRRVAYSRPTAKHGSDKELKMRRNPMSETVLDLNGEGGPGEWFRTQTLNWAL